MTEFQLVDTHSHLYVDVFRNDIQQVMDRAAQEGVGKIYLPAIDSEELDNLLGLEQQFPGKCLAMMGLHPCSVKDDVEKELALVEEWLAKRQFAAVGEIGLDYYWDKTHVEQQKSAFHRQIEWALHYDLPIVIHSRQSTQDCIDIVRQHQKGGLRGIFHCFGDDEKTAKQIIELGFYLGIGGVLTYKNSGLAQTLSNISLDHLVLETDSPYLTPVPFRGKRNESSYLKYIAAKLAEVKGASLEEVARVTTRNAENVFGN